MNGYNIFLNEISIKYYDEIYSFCRRRVRSSEDAYDLTQEVFLALKEKIDKINLLSMRKWLYNTAHNKICDYYTNRKKENDNCTDIDVYDETLDLTTDFTEEITEDEIERHKVEILSLLSNDEKEFYDDVWIKHKTYKSLASKYNISEPALRKRVSRLHYKIRKCIKELQLL